MPSHAQVQAARDYGIAARDAALAAGANAKDATAAYYNALHSRLPPGMGVIVF